MSVSLLLIMSLLSAILYRIGGSDLHVPLKTKWRDLGVPLCGLICLIALVPNTGVWLYYIALGSYFILSFGSMTTYWDKWGDDNVQWYEWGLTGLCYGLSAFPIALYNGRWIGFGLRTIILTLCVIFSNKLRKEWLVEPSRGFVFTITMPLLVL